MSQCLICGRCKHNVVINNGALYCIKYLAAPSKNNLIEYKNKNLLLGHKNGSISNSSDTDNLSSISAAHEERTDTCKLFLELHRHFVAGTHMHTHTQIHTCTYTRTHAQKGEGENNCKNKTKFNYSCLRSYLWRFYFYFS